MIGWGVEISSSSFDLKRSLRVRTISMVSFPCCIQTPDSLTPSLPPHFLSMSTFSAKPTNVITSLHNHHKSIFSFPTCLPSLSKLQKASPVVAFNGARLQHKRRRTNPQTTLPTLPTSTFLQMGSQETSSETPFLVKSTGSESASTSSASQTVSKSTFLRLISDGIASFVLFQWNFDKSC